jgi:PTS system ascorbate-specific IIB component
MRIEGDVMEDIKIQTVCGFGCGSSLLLRMNIEEVLKENNLKATVFCGDLGTCLSQPCDAIFISEELWSRIEGRTTVTIVPIKNFMDKKEITTKTMEFMNSLN